MELIDKVYIINRAYSPFLNGSFWFLRGCLYKTLVSLNTLKKNMFLKYYSYYLGGRGKTLILSILHFKFVNVLFSMNVWIHGHALHCFTAETKYFYLSCLFYISLNLFYPYSDTIQIYQANFNIFSNTL